MFKRYSFILSFVVLSCIESSLLGMDKSSSFQEFALKNLVISSYNANSIAVANEPIARVISTGFDAESAYIRPAFADTCRCQNKYPLLRALGVFMEDNGKGHEVCCHKGRAWIMFRRLSFDSRDLVGFKDIVHCHSSLSK